MNLADVELVLAVVAVAVGAAGLGLGAVLAARASDRVKGRIEQFVRSPKAIPSSSDEPVPSALTQARRGFNSVFAVLDSEEMRRKLVAADWSVTVSEYWLLRLGAALLAFMVGLLVLRNVLPALGLAFLAYLGPGVLLFRSILARQRLFQNQLLDTLTLIRGAVAAGYSFQQSLNVVIQEMRPPISEEFRQVRREVELGIPLSRALESLAARMESEDFNLVVIVLIINMQIGGNLTAILNVVMKTIRERIALFSEIRALTAYANFAGYLLTLLPFVTVVILAVLSPVYWRQLLEPGATRIALIYALCSLLVGNVLLRRVGRLKV